VNPLLALAAVCLLASLAGCLPLSGGFDTAAGGPPQTAIVTVDNPFLCPKATAP
jgi:hypothetical protein